MNVLKESLSLESFPGLSRFIGCDDKKVPRLAQGPPQIVYHLDFAIVEVVFQKVRSTPWCSQG